jgi:hypothetical protein
VPISSYQVEWVINQRKRWRGLVRMVERKWRALGDRVELSEAGSEQARRQAGPPPKPTQVAPTRSGDVWPLDLAERTSYGPAVDYERERRAGSFMKPKYPPFPPPLKIPKMKRKKRGTE